MLSLAELLESADKLARAANDKRLEAVTPLLDVLQLASARMKEDTFVLIDQLPVENLSPLEDFLGTGLLFKETIAFEPLLNAPSRLLSFQDKQDQEETLAATKKEAIRKLLENLPFGLDTLGKPISDLLEQIDELLAALRGKEKEKK